MKERKGKEEEKGEAKKGKVEEEKDEWRGRGGGMGKEGKKRQDMKGRWRDEMEKLEWVIKNKKK